VELLTGMELDAHGAAHELDKAPRDHRRQRLEKLGGLLAQD
jgi:hypothetical protein